MTKIKKVLFISICLGLMLTIMACHIPLISRATSPGTKAVEDTPAETVERLPLEETETKALPQEKVYEDNGVEMTLPATFILGDVENDFKSLMNQGQSLEDEQAQTINGIFENYKEDILMWAYDPGSDGQYGTGLLVMKNDQFAGMSLMLISTFAKSIIGDQLDFVDQQRIKMDNRDVLRFETSTGDMGVKSSQAFYIFNESGKLWIIAFFTDSEQIQESLLDFDQAVESFKFIGDE
ncbi:MAG TPA: hypothetical protein VIM80_02060 [Brevefilum sp.]